MDSITIRTATPRGTRARRSTVTNGFSSSANSAPMMNSRSTGPAARRMTYRPDHRERERDELHPARNDEARVLRSAHGQYGYSTSSSRERLSCTPTSILFIGDVVARAGRRAVRDMLPGLREELELDFVVANGENAAGGIGITPKEAEGAVRRRRRRDHARQPHVPPPRGLAVPRRAAEHPAPGELPAHAARPRHDDRRARRHVARRRQPQRQPLPAGGQPGAGDDRRGAEGGRRTPITCWSTCTPRRRARRSRSAGTSTATSRPSSARTRTCRPPTRACSRAGPPTSPTSA